MSVTVAVNNRTVVHKKSGGVALAFPDVCLTPPGPFPVPYLNLARAEDATATCDSVFCDGEPVMKASSYLRQSYGDEPGTAGGLISGVNRGRVSFLSFSFDVRFEGEGVPRAFDETGHNHGSPYNEVAYLMQALLLETDLEQVLCAILCHCNIPFEKMVCLRPFLAAPVVGPVFWGDVYGGHWDPFIPHIWIEVPYAWNTKDKQFDPIGNPIDSQFQKDEHGNPLPIPMSATAPAPGTLRPDIVVTTNPRKPPTPDNIHMIYEVKFDGDDDEERNANQKADYERIYPKARVEILNAENCGCDIPPVPPPVRVSDPEPEPKPAWKPKPMPPWFWPAAFGGAVLLMTGGAGALAFA